MWNPKAVIAEPIKRANTIAYVALGVALIAITMAFVNGVKHHAG